MWKIHPLFEEIGKVVDENLMMLPNKPSKDFIGSAGPTTWALVVMNSMEKEDGVWIFSKEEFLTNNVNVIEDWAVIIVAIIKTYEKEIEQTFDDFTVTRWGGHWEDITQTAKYYDEHGVDGKRLYVKTDRTYEQETIYDREVEFSYPLSGFIFSATQAINRANVLEVFK
jgi:hypothetical protein